MILEKDNIEQEKHMQSLEDNIKIDLLLLHSLYIMTRTIARNMCVLYAWVTINES